MDNYIDTIISDIQYVLQECVQDAGLPEANYEYYLKKFWEYKYVGIALVKHRSRNHDIHTK